MHSVLMSGSGEKRVNEESFNRILGRSRQVHFVQSPILLFPRWRRQVGLIRVGGISERSTSASRKQGMVMNRRGSPRASRGNKSNMLVSTIFVGCQQRKLFDYSFLSIAQSYGSQADEEPCSLKIQYMLVEDYVAYLRLIGLQLLNIE